MSADRRNSRSIRAMSLPVQNARCDISAASALLWSKPLPPSYAGKMRDKTASLAFHRSATDALAPNLLAALPDDRSIIAISASSSAGPV